jgi:hypothetical protein
VVGSELLKNTNRVIPQRRNFACFLQRESKNIYICTAKIILICYRTHYLTAALNLETSGLQKFEYFWIKYISVRVVKYAVEGEVSF